MPKCYYLEGLNPRDTDEKIIDGLKFYIPDLARWSQTYSIEPTDTEEKDNREAGTTRSDDHEPSTAHLNPPNSNPVQLGRCTFRSNPESNARALHAPQRRTVASARRSPRPFGPIPAPRIRRNSPRPSRELIPCSLTIGDAHRTPRLPLPGPLHEPRSQPRARGIAPPAPRHPGGGTGERGARPPRQELEW